MPSAAETYGVRDSYRRFNQRMEMFCRSIWDERARRGRPAPEDAEAQTGSA